MKVSHGRRYTAPRAWGATEIASMNGISTRLHWTDQPYHWHRNDGEEVLVVLDGRVDMHYRSAGTEGLVTLEAGDIFYAEDGCEHMARPQGAARLLVIERAGSE